MFVAKWWEPTHEAPSQVQQGELKGGVTSEKWITHVCGLHEAKHTCNGQRVLDLVPPGSIPIVFAHDRSKKSGKTTWGVQAEI